MKIYVLEDSQERLNWFRKAFVGHELYWTSDAEQACIDVLENTYDFIFIDRDLGKEKTGEYFTSFFRSLNKIIDSKIIIHSMNAPAQKRMKEDLSHCQDVEIIPFSTLMSKVEEFLNLE